MLPEEIQSGLVRGEVRKAIAGRSGFGRKIGGAMALYRDIVEKNERQAGGEDYQKHGQRDTGGRRKRQCGIEIGARKKLADTLGTKVQIEMAGGGLFP